MERVCTMVLGLILFSAVGADIAHYSISLFAIKCLWPPAVVVAAAALCIAVIVIVCLHVRAAWRDGILLGRCIEIAATALIFVLPVFRDRRSISIAGTGPATVCTRTRTHGGRKPPARSSGAAI